MKCKKCGGEIKLIENFTANSYYNILEETENSISVEFVKDDDFSTNSKELKCTSCNAIVESSKEIEY